MSRTILVLKYTLGQVAANAGGFFALFGQMGLGWDWWWLRLAIVCGSGAAFTYSLYLNYLYRRIRPYWEAEDEANYQHYCDRLFASPSSAPITGELLPAATSDSLRLYKWENAIDDACGLIIAGQAGYGKSSLALYFLGLFTQSAPAYIKVLDPHGRINHWGEHGLTVIFDFEAIESELKGALGELNRRRQLTKDEVKKEPAYIYVCDEVSACLDNFSQPKMVSKALRRLGCEGRKYGVSLIAIAHSHNGDALGIDAKYRSNYLLVLVGDSARQVAEDSWKRSSPEYQYIDVQPYPCMVSGSVRDMAALHPTHGHHSHYKKVGNAPQNLLEIRQLHGDVVVTNPISKITNSDLAIFKKIKEGRERGISKTALIAEIWRCQPNGSNFSRARANSPLNEYERIVDTYALPWILALLDAGMGDDEILDLVWPGTNAEVKLQKIKADNFYQ